MSNMISANDEKAIEIAIEVLLSSKLNELRVIDIEDTLEMEFDDFYEAHDTFHRVLKEFRAKKGL